MGTAGLCHMRDRQGANATRMPLLLDRIAGMAMVFEDIRPVKIILALATLLLLVPLVSVGEEPMLAKELKFTDVWASRQNDSREYVLLGGGWIRGFRSGNPERFASRWLAKHPSATIRQISQMLMNLSPPPKEPTEVVYVWIEDGDAALNVDLVRAGVFPAGAMLDMVDYRRAIDKVHDDTRLAPGIKARVEKEREENPNLLRPERLIPDDDYKGRLARVQTAEAEARARKRGVWADSMKEEREADGYP